MEIQYPLDNLIPEIVSDSNMYSGYDYVISHLESKEQRAKYAPDKEPKTEYDFNTPEEYTAYLKQQIYAAKVRDAIIGTLKRQIADGTFIFSVTVFLMSSKIFLASSAPLMRARIRSAFAS